MDIPTEHGPNRLVEAPGVRGVSRPPGDASKFRWASGKFLDQLVICEDELPVEDPVAVIEIVEGFLT